MRIIAQATGKTKNIRKQADRSAMEQKKRGNYYDETNSLGWRTFTRRF